MAYFCIRRDDNDYVITTTIQAVHEFSGLPYYKVYDAIKNGHGLSEIDGFLMGGAPLKKGRQRVPITENIPGARSDTGMRTNKDGDVVSFDTLPQSKADDFDLLFKDVKNDNPD